MRTFSILLVCAALIGLVHSVSAEESKSDSRLWVNNKLTPEQPFPARVVAVSASWVGYTLLLEEITDDEIPLLCIAEVGYMGVKYSVDLVGQHSVNRMKHEQMHTEFLKKPIAVSGFSWDKGIGKLGLKYGKDDALRGWYKTVKEQQRAAFEHAKQVGGRSKEASPKAE